MKITSLDHLPRKMSISICKTLSSGERGLLSIPVEDSHRLGLDWLIRSLLILDILCFFQKKKKNLKVLVFIDSSRFCTRGQKYIKKCPYQEVTHCGFFGGSVLSALQGKCSNMEKSSSKMRITTAELPLNPLHHSTCAHVPQTRPKAVIGENISLE